ncbi:unnamed protein product [Allacma fusca]|uniref:TATA element modulatory factor 1 TATA binding domain-containing protein n=1 Tax=Allacma fusca TaxID=39272 RepID=A0A8J2PAL7_9HEXA|nr:unnamed protein product [Allacma fusca]
MSWFQSTNFASLAKTALKEAQKTIDKALDIKDENSAARTASVVAEPSPDIALTESEILLDSGIVTSSLLDADETDDCSVVVTDLQSAVIVNSSLSESVTLDENSSKWSTIEIETLETSHSRNSSISTIPDTNSTSSPERDIGRCGNIYDNVQVAVLGDIETIESGSGIVPKSIIAGESSGSSVSVLEDVTPVTSDEVPSSNASTFDGDMQTIVENDIESQSSSSFEHVSTTSDPLANNSCLLGRTTSPVGSSSLQLNHPGNHNKFVAKIKTTASSASSSDIEVIPLDPEEQTISKILQEAETQTDDSSFPMKTPDKSKIAKTDEGSTKLTNIMEEKLNDKEKEIDQLRQEGEKLSKKQYEFSNVIKKLRAREKDTENNIKTLKSELSEKNLELERLMKIFVNKEGIEQTQLDQISKLSAENRKLEVEIERLKSELEDAVENCNSMKISVENSALEILETKNVILATQREAGEIDQLKREKFELLSCNETLQKEVDRLRSVVNDTQKQSALREQDLKSQLTTATAKCHLLENQLSDIASDIADATMPLSLEIEKLQQELKNSTSIADKRENTLMTKIIDLEQIIKSTQDRESSFAQMEQAYQSSIHSLEFKLDQLEEENKRIRNVSKEQKNQLELQVNDLSTQLEDALSEAEKLKSAKESIERDFHNEQSEKKKIHQLLEQHMRSSQITNSNVFPSGGNNHNNNIGNYIASTTASSSTMTSSTITTQQQMLKPASGQRSGENSPSNTSVLSEVSYLDEVFDNGQNVRSMTPKSFFESFSSANVIENLHSQLRLRDGELHQFQEEVAKNERIRKTLNEEIAQLTIQNHELLLQMENLTDLQNRLEEVEKKYNTVLQLYGEKVEEAEELRLDLEDVKKMYTEQIDKLFER